MSDASLHQKSEIVSYRSLIGAILGAGLTPKRFRDYRESLEEAAVLLVRHDVDLDFEKSYELAKIEREIGIRATYFVLPPGDYGETTYYGSIIGKRVRHSTNFFQKCREIQDMGHEIALHNDFSTLAYITRRPMPDLIMDEIAAFAQEGIQIIGSASHGSKMARRHELVNYEIFKECTWRSRPDKEVGRWIRQEDWEIRLHQIAMSDVGLSYEAYFLPRNITMVDTGGNVSLTVGSVTQKGLSFTSSDGFEKLRQSIMQQAKVRMVLLVHPDRWDFSQAS